jgi:uncharacterized protein YeaC (DUF1315 family)
MTARIFPVYKGYKICVEMGKWPQLVLSKVDFVFNQI